MKLNELYGKKFVVSFEIFPPKTPAGDTNLWRELKLLSAHKPDFVSVTYGAGGSTRTKTLEIALKVRNEFSITPIVHFTCVNAGKEDIRSYISEVKNHGIENIMALRGDPPLGETKFTPHPDGFRHADELIEFLHEIGDFTIAAAGYPEVHTEALSMEDDIINLKKKQDAGAGFIITQLFYDNNAFYSFMDRAVKAGITIPVIPGIMPITTKSQIDHLVELSGTKIPSDLMDRLNRCSSKEEEAEAGLEFSIRQCTELKDWGIKGLHIYTMNKSNPVTSIMKALGL